VWSQDVDHIARSSVVAVRLGYRRRGYGRQRKQAMIDEARCMAYDDSCR